MNHRRRHILLGISALTAGTRLANAGLLDPFMSGGQKDAYALYRAAENGSQEAFDKLLLNSRQGDNWSSMQFGYLYHVGRAPGTSPRISPGYPPGGSIPTAIKAYKIASGQMTPEGNITGNVFSAYNLGLIYLWGQDGGTPKAQEAVRWFRACSRDNSDRPFLPSVMHLAAIYEQGFGGVPEDQREAVHWYSRAASMSEPTALLKWGIALIEGKGAERNYFEGTIHLQRAAELWDRDAMYYLASMYAKGNDYQEQNLFQAAQWLWIAATGAPRYRPAADALIARFSKPEQERIKQVSRLWITGHMRIPPRIEYNAPLNADVPTIAP
ncbi:tetratricopeptide repeat protein [Burkholderia sp. MBR-1]|uniref:tetratricopeptide repeat protein n=1 Tax=Burkholderia sp. MBR-1 TaxID=2732364 RepID=UPI0015EF12F0|nr:tetratricopeptide repeat protein [Burkholderia sp. MBR-1]QMI49685.1 sel1 repeat family protein [Burkholderia sp. MBR-1]